MQIEYSIIEYFDVEDGEKFCIQQRDIYSDEDELTDQILMDRKVAIELAHDILNILGDNIL